jgi:hypothetical protein
VLNDKEKMKIQPFEPVTYDYNGFNDIEPEFDGVDIDFKLIGNFRFYLYYQNFFYIKQIIIIFIDIFQSEFGKLPLPNKEFCTFHCTKESFIENSIILQLSIPKNSPCFHHEGRADHCAKIVKFSTDNLFAQIQYENGAQAVVWCHQSILKSMNFLGRRSRK